MAERGETMMALPVSELHCPHCHSTHVYAVDGHYVCVDCGTVISPVYYLPVSFHDRRKITLRAWLKKQRLYEQQGGERAGTRHMRYLYLYVTLERDRKKRIAIEMAKRQATEERKENRELRIAKELSRLCAEFNIPRIECARAMEIYRSNKRIRMKLQSAKAKNVAVALLVVALGIPPSVFKNNDTIRRLVKRIRR